MSDKNTPKNSTTSKYVKPTVTTIRLQGVCGEPGTIDTGPGYSGTDSGSGSGGTGGSGSTATLTDTDIIGGN